MKDSNWFPWSTGGALLFSNLNIRCSSAHQLSYVFQLHFINYSYLTFLLLNLKSTIGNHKIHYKIQVQFCCNQFHIWETGSCSSFYIYSSYIDILKLQEKQGNENYKISHNPPKQKNNHVKFYLFPYFVHLTQFFIILIYLGHLGLDPPTPVSWVLGL